MASRRGLLNTRGHYRLWPACIILRATLFQFSSQRPSLAFVQFGISRHLIRELAKTRRHWIIGSDFGEGLRFRCQMAVSSRPG